MATIETIKQKIRQMEAGEFQNLCDAYLSKIGYPNIVSLGAEAGTRKTTKGTPDTYFYTLEGKYVFVEYTTQQQNLFNKILVDLTKCLNTSKTGIAPDKISEIIYCHTSSIITIAQDNELKVMCEEVGIKFTIIGIDKLAEELYLSHHGIASDFLGISLSTDQIQLHDDFVKRYNANRMAAPIDTKFLFRDKEIGSIGEAYQKADVVILNGSAGAGKTRLALQYAKSHSIEHNEKLFCIHNNALPIYGDLKLFIDVPGNYFLVIDDANQLSGLQHIIRYTTMKSEGYNVKILITVRDYAVQKVKNDIREITSYEVVNIGKFTDDEIKTLLESSLGISNPDYLERIVRISEGNARIAVLAGKVACDSHRLDSINDVSQLYEDYYGVYLNENQSLADNDLLVTAGIVAFLESIHLDYIDSLLPILNSKGLNRDNFIENIRKLHEKEIVDICNDKAVRFSEQCLSNFLLKYVFFDKKLLSLSEMIKACFQSYKERTVTSINIMINIFRNKDFHKFVENEVILLWNELDQENSLYFFDFVKVFFPVNPTEALLILHEKIELEDAVIINSIDIDTEKGKNYQNVSNDIVEILGGFANMADLPTALDLFFQYYLKRQDLYMQFYHAVILYFGIKKDTNIYGYITQITFLEKLKEYSDDWKNESVVILFFEVTKELLKLCFNPTEGGRKNTFTMYTIQLTLTEGVEKYRSLIWEYLSELSMKENYKNNIIKILNSYGGQLHDISLPVLQFDLVYIKSLVESAFPPFELQNCILADKLIQVVRRLNISCEPLFSEYFTSVYFKLYHFLKGPEYNGDIGFEELQKSKQQAIDEYVVGCDLMMFKRIIDICYDVNASDEHEKWEVGEGLDIAFNALAHKKELYVDAIRYYLEKNTPNDLHPYRLVNMLFSLMSELDVYKLINSYEYNQKNMWLYAYYHELPQKQITQSHLSDLYTFLSDSSDKEITSSSPRDVDFLEKYNFIDKEAFIKGCKIILSKMEYSPFMANIYFRLMFNHIHNTPQIVIQKFGNDFKLLEDIYIALLAHDEHHDYNGRFLKEIYLFCPSILDKYIQCLINKNSGYHHMGNERNSWFFELDNFIEVFDTIFEQLIQGYQYPTMSVPYFLESLLLPSQNEKKMLKKQDEWINHCIRTFSDDAKKMYCVFSVISKFNMDRKIKYIWLYLENNQSFEDFIKIPLTPTSLSWSGSAVPMYSNWIEFLESLLPSFTGLKWIKHKNYVVTKIECLKKQIETEQIEEILRG